MVFTFSHDQPKMDSIFVSDDSFPKEAKNTKLYINIYAATRKSNVDHFSRLILSETAVFKTGFKTRPVI